MSTARRQARIIALKALYEQEFHYQDMNAKKLIQNPSLKDPELKAYSIEVFKGVKNKRKEIDALIKKISKFWKLERMSLIDLNIMRIAIYEMIYSVPTIPFKVCINEAMEIAKIYGTSDSTSFINGILDSISKKVQNGTSTLYQGSKSANGKQTN